MLYMVELRYTAKHGDDALRYFWEHGTTHYEGKVVLKGTWVATHDQVAYALVECHDAGEIEKACAPLAEFGKVEYRPVVSGDEI